MNYSRKSKEELKELRKQFQKENLFTKYYSFFKEFEPIYCENENSLIETWDKAKIVCQEIYDGPVPQISVPETYEELLDEFKECVDDRSELVSRYVLACCAIMVIAMKHKTDDIEKLNHLQDIYNNIMEFKSAEYCRIFNELGSLLECEPCIVPNYDYIDLQNLPSTEPEQELVQKVKVELCKQLFAKYGIGMKATQKDRAKLISKLIGGSENKINSLLSSPKSIIPKSETKTINDINTLLSKLQVDVVLETV